MDYENCVLEASSAAGSGVTFDKSGYISVKGESASYEMTMIYNEGSYVTDWYTIGITGENADEITFEQTDDGYILSGSNLQNVVVMAENDAHSPEVSFTTDYTQVLIYEIDENTIGIAADADGDGEYETAVAESEGRVRGDVNGDGSVDLDDASITLTIYAGKAAGLSLDAFTEDEIAAADVDGDGKPGLSDASAILTYYAGKAAGLEADWDSILGTV